MRNLVTLIWSLISSDLTVTDFNRQRMKELAVRMKGKRQLRIGDLLELLQPLANISTVRGITLAALANSPTEKDRKFVTDLADKEDSISLELLNSLFESKNPKNLSYWLKYLYTKKIPANYFIFSNEQPLLKSDELLPDLHIAFLKIKDPKILAQLVEALRGRTDAQSVDIVITLLSHTDSTVRYFAALTTRDNPAARFKEPDIQKLIQRDLHK